MGNRNILYHNLEDPAEQEVLSGFGDKHNISISFLKKEILLENEIKENAIVLLDSVSPGPNSYELGLRLKKEKNVYVIILTNSDYKEEADLLCKTNGMTYLIRPITLYKLEEIINKNHWELKRPPIKALSYIADKQLDELKLSETILKELEKNDFPSKDFLKLLLDKNTGLYHKAFMVLRLEEELKRATRFNIPLTVVLLKLMNQNDTDKVPPKELKLSVSGRLLTETRDIDSLGVWDEDSFLLILPGTPVSGAMAMMKRVFDKRQAIFLAHDDWSLSFGISKAPSNHVIKWKDLIKEAESSLKELF